MISPRLAKVLRRDRTLHAAVSLNLEGFERWLGGSKTPFFPEYTDHGPDHVINVIAKAEALIRDEAWAALTPADAATLVLAILLHDCGMHLSEDGFAMLVGAAPGAWPPPLHARDVAWPQLWQDFLWEARHFDERRLVALFGDPEPIVTPPADPAKMTKRDRVLVGEFLRRHHPRLAHEIALAGVPGPGADRLTLKEVPDAIKNLAGLVARSHGVALRTAVDFLSVDDRLVSHQVHAPFAMAVVRIADYLHVESARAPGELLKVTALRSPVSRREWAAHAAILDIHTEHQDPEAIYVKAAPGDARTYLRVKHLLRDLQTELDASWSALGEIYGRHDKLKKLGLTLRRIRSNLDDERTFAATAKYVPGGAAFDVSGPDLLKLLVGPLYGNKPAVGVRELVQNAVDACREMEDYLQRHPAPALERPEQAADVVVELAPDGDGGWLTVNDRGIGMTVDVVRNYFLKAGASFRRSDAWIKQHVDEKDGKPRVLRSGRFGIGVLACFLLGDTIEVWTRHVTSPAERGIHFRAGITDDVVELDFLPCPVGTRIRVRVSKAVLDGLIERQGDWDWYCLAHPSVERRIAPGQVLRQDQTLPAAGASLSIGWHRLATTDFEDVQWSYVSRSTLVCNGIRVESSWSGSWTQMRLGHSGQLDAYTPLISVFDAAGKLPLNLQRTDLASVELPFHHELVADVCRDLTADLLVSAPTGPFAADPAAYASMRTSWFPVTSRFDGAVAWLWCTADGISLIDPWHFSVVAPSILLGAPTLTDVPAGFAAPGNKALPAVFARLDYDATRGRRGRDREQHLQWLHHAVGQFSYEMYDPTRRSVGRRVLVTSAFLNRIREAGDDRRLEQFVEGIEWSNDDWMLLKGRNCPPERGFDLAAFTAEPPKTETSGLAIFYFAGWGKLEGELSPIARVWRDVLGTPVIPYDPAKRRARLAEGFAKLKPYIDVQQTLAEARAAAARDQE